MTNTQTTFCAFFFHVVVVSSATAAQPDSMNGSISAGYLTVPEGVSLSELHVDVEGTVEYMRGQFVKRNRGELVSIDRIMADLCNDAGCRTVELDAPVYQASSDQVDWTAVAGQLDPDGPAAGSCVYAGIQDGKHTFRDTNSWCEIRFTQNDPVVLVSAMQPVVAGGGGSRITGVTIETESPPETGVGMVAIGAGADVPVRFEDYSGSKDKTFTAIVANVFDAPGPFTANEARQHQIFQGFEVKLYREQRQGFVPYEGYPRVGSAIRSRSVSFHAEFEEGRSENQIRLLLVPDFWDGSLPTCSEPTFNMGLFCNAGYIGEVTLYVTDATGSSILSKRLEFEPAINLK